jgi:hypothetical protein
VKPKSFYTVIIVSVFNKENTATDHITGEEDDNELNVLSIEG